MFASCPHAIWILRTVILYFGSIGIFLLRKNKQFDYLGPESYWWRTEELYCVKLYLMSSAIRGLWFAQVAMVVTMATMENTREMPRRGSGNGHEQENKWPRLAILRVLGVLLSYRQGFKTTLDDMTSTFHYLHWCKLWSAHTWFLSFMHSALSYSEEGNGVGRSSIST